MNRIDLQWGRGSFDVVLDLRSGRLLAYSSEEAAAAIHSSYGGMNYYRSRSGARGAGWVPSSPVLRTPMTYRVDTVYVEGDVVTCRPPTVGGYEIYVPIDLGRGIDSDWPIVVKEGSFSAYSGDLRFGGKLFLVDRDGLFSLLENGDQEFEAVEISTTCVGWVGPECYPAEKKTEVYLRRGWQKIPSSYRRAIEGLLLKKFAPEIAEGDEFLSREEDPFWARLGIRRTRRYPGILVKMSKGIGSAVYRPDELASTEALQAVAPASVMILDPNLYLQGSNDFDVVARLQFGGSEVQVEARLELSQAIRAMRGDTEGLVEALLCQAEGKFFDKTLEEGRLLRWQALRDAGLESPDPVIQFCRNCDAVLRLEDFVAAEVPEIVSSRFLAEGEYVSASQVVAMGIYGTDDFYEQEFVTTVLVMRFAALAASAREEVAA